MLRRRHSMAMRPKQGEGGVLELFGPRFYGDHGDEMTHFLGLIGMMYECLKLKDTKKSGKFSRNSDETT